MIREEWRRIYEFPQYSISNYGRVRDEHRDRLMATSPNGFAKYNRGHLKISLLDRATGVRYTRSIALLVAQNFVPAPDALSDAVIRLDGKEENVVAWNLAWRPHWFAWQYSHQLREDQPLAFTNLHVQNMDQGFVYKSIIEAGKSEGLLFHDLWRSVNTGARIYPHRCVYQVVERV